MSCLSLLHAQQLGQPGAQAPVQPGGPQQLQPGQIQQAQLTAQPGSAPGGLPVPFFAAQPGQVPGAQPGQTPLAPGSINQASLLTGLESGGKGSVSAQSANNFVCLRHKSHRLVGFIFTHRIFTLLTLYFLTGQLL